MIETCQFCIHELKLPNEEPCKECLKLTPSDTRFEADVTKILNREG